MDLDDLDIFDRYSTGTFALISGMAIIGIVTYFLYVILPLLDGQQMVFFFSVLAFVFGIFIPLFFFMEDLGGSSDILGKFLAGIVVAAIVWISYHNYNTEGLDGTGLSLYIVLPSIFTFFTSLTLVKGVVISLIEEGGFGGGGWEGIEEDYEEEEEDDYEVDDLDDELEPEPSPKRKQRNEEELYPEERDTDW